MKRPVIIVAVFTLVAAHGCTCGFPSQDTPPCGDIGQPCCAFGCLNGGCNFGPLLAQTACVRGTCEFAPLEGGAHDAVADVSGVCDSGLACERCNVSPYVPMVMNAPLITSNACTPAELQAFVTACFSGTATTATCLTWSQADTGPCGACLASVVPASAHWGPFVCNGSTCGANTGGCVDLVLGTVADELNQGGLGSCGDALTDNIGCDEFACAACAATDQDACIASAAANECASYQASVSWPSGPCAAANGDAAPAGVARCFPQNDAENVDFLNVFCGTGP